VNAWDRAQYRYDHAEPPEDLAYDSFIMWCEEQDREPDDDARAEWDAEQEAIDENFLLNRAGY
jgi:hypothetical protein